MMDVLANVAAFVGKAEHPLLETHEKQLKTLIIVMTSDRGLCGAFNANILRKAQIRIEKEKDEGKEVSVLVIGRKGNNYFRYIGENIFDSYLLISDKPSYDNAREIGEKVIDLYQKRETNRVYLFFNHFKSVMEQIAVEHLLLPIEEEVVEEETQKEFVAEYIFEPSPKKVLYSLLPTYIETLLYRALLESAASEHAARRTAMKSATENAEEMIGQLTRSFNRARQAQITQEISEIVGGANAL